MTSNQVNPDRLKLDEKHKLTILLTLKDRVPFTIRWLRYTNTWPFPFKILIADGGKDSELPVLLSNRANFPNLNYEYRRYPYDQTYSHYYAKMVDALAHVETPFVAIADNDDFFLPEGLANSVEFLQNHAEYSSCGGHIAGVRVVLNDRYGHLSQVYGDEKDIYFSPEIYPAGSALDVTAAKRVDYYFTKYRCTWYNVGRTPDALSKFCLLQKLDIKDIILASDLPELLGVASGKVQREKFLYLVRQLSSPSTSYSTEVKEKGDYFDRMLAASWSADITGFVNAIAMAISQKDGISTDEACRQVRRGYRNFVAHGVIEGLLDQMPASYRYRIARDITSRIKPIFWSLRSLINRNSAEKQSIPARRFVTSYPEFKPIYNFLIASPSSIEIK
ncbi:MAG: TIGR00180 family glycosyltransferase [Anaerolineaceae bacterium]|nr:TIGR00180 family glycosyltransferase [Anaerolineaceae bacterium]